MYSSDFKNISSTRDSKIPKGQTEILNSDSREDQQNETKDKHTIHNTTLKAKPGVTQILQKPG